MYVLLETFFPAAVASGKLLSHLPVAAAVFALWGYEYLLDNKFILSVVTKDGHRLGYFVEADGRVRPAIKSGFTLNRCAPGVEVQDKKASVGDELTFYCANADGTWEKVCRSKQLLQPEQTSHEAYKSVLLKSVNDK
jgi:hypothetical protein